ncbi:MAG: hypothetical protein NDI63_05275 [Pseudobdellovibrio sp.]|nr:hypothetical protein [Pseudobdellovibrio sp.]
MKKFLVLAIALLSTLPVSATEYLRSCYDDNSDYLQTLVNLNNSEWMITYTAFEDRSCETPYLHYEVKYQTQQSANNIDMIATEVSYTALSELVGEVLNQINYCGFNNWKAFEKKVVTGKVCDEFQTPKANEVLYSIFELKNDGTELFLGMPSGDFNGKSPERRHQSLDPLGFTLQ